MSNTTEQPTTAATPAPMTREFFSQMVTAYQRLLVLMGTTIKQSGDDAELVAQRTFLARAFLTHGAEFLNSWLVVTEEYDPLVRSFASLQQRSNNFIAIRQAQYDAAAKAASGPADPVKAEGDDNVIDVDFSSQSTSSQPADK